MSIKPRRIRAASGGKIDAFIDTFGGGYVDLALELGVAPDRIDTIIDFAAAAKHGVKMEGNSAAAMPRCLQNSTPVGVDEPRDCEAYGPKSVKGLLSQPNTYLSKLLQTADASSGDLVSASGPHSDRRSAKSIEPRGAITPGVPELRLMSGGQDVRRGHRGMGIRRSSVKNRKAGVSGDGVAVRLPNNATLRSVRRHIPLYVGICVQPYCGQHR